MSHAKRAGRRDSDLSARFTAAEKERVERALARTGKNLSQFVRDAVLGEADRALGEDPLAAFGSSLRAIKGPSGAFGRNAKTLYFELLEGKHLHEPPSNQ